MMNFTQLNPMKYLLVIFSFSIVFLFPLFIWGKSAEDHFASISLDGHSGYYQNFDDRMTREIQDRDIFFHNIGRSIDQAKKADIILLGHSMLLFGLNFDLIEAFEYKYGIKIYNLAMAGDASGEFLRRIIKRWHLNPKLWIINADDHAANFFSISFDDFGQCGTSSINTIKYNRITAYLHVIGRNLRWHLLDFIEEVFPKTITKSLFKDHIFTVFRSVDNGNWYLEKVPPYVSGDNSFIKLTRPQDCHTNPAEIVLAKRYLRKIGGSSILMLTPYVGFCPNRVQEMGKILHIESIIPPDPTKYTTWDGGGHLDKKGAVAFTTFFLSSLEKTDAFKKVILNKKTTI